MAKLNSRQNVPSALPIALAVFSLAAAPTFAQLVKPERVSVSSAEEQSENLSGNAAVSADGRFVVFHSFASNLVAGDTNGVEDVFLRDRAAGTTERVSLASDRSEADGPSGSLGLGGWLVSRLDVSDDGRFVAFTSYATNLVPGDTNDEADIFVRDREMGTTERVSVASDETEATGESNEMVAISGDGRFVAFDFVASNLVEDDGNFTDVFLRDRQAGTTELVNISNGGEQGDGAARYPDVSDDGRFVVYESGAANLVAGDGNGEYDIFLRDRQVGTTQRINAPGGVDPDGVSTTPRISGDGRFVVFSSEATNLVASDINNVRDVFVYDRQAGTTERVNVDSTGVEANGESVSAGGAIGISGDGRFIAFTSRATNLVTGDTNDTADIFLRDRQIGETRPISLTTAGGESDNYSEEPAISGDGRVIGFDSGASNLVADDTNRLRDVYVVDLTPRPQRYEYVAKVVCGVQTERYSGLLTPGMYATTINVHNPNEADVRFFKKLALTVPPGAQKPGRILPIAEDTLAYDEALASDCDDLQRRLFPGGFPDRVIEGYLVIQSPAPLDVDAVYTTAAVGPEGRPLHSSIDVERIAERDRAEGCDLEVAKEAEMTPVTDPSLPSFTMYFLLYTVNVTNHCDMEATNVRLEDVVRTSLPATISLVVWPAPVVVEPAGTLAPSAPVIQPDGTLSVDVNGHIPALPAGDVGVFQFWATVLRYEFDGAPQHTQLIDEAEIESDLLEEDVVNNQASVSTNLF